MFKTKNDIPEATRIKAVELLNARLADCIDLLTQTKQAHWNIKGQHFIALHELFDKINEEVEDYVDEIAERAVQLGGVAEGTARIVARRSSLDEYPVHAVDGRSHVEALSSALAAFGRAARKAISEANEIGELDTADLFTEVSRGIDKWLWFAEAHLQAEKITGSAGSRLRLRLVETDGKDPNTKTFYTDNEWDITATNGDLFYKFSPGLKIVVQLGGSAELPLCTMTFSYLGTEFGWRVISGSLIGILNVQTNEEHDGFPPATPCQGIKNYPVQWAITISQPPYNVVGWFAGLNGNAYVHSTAGTWQKC